MIHFGAIVNPDINYCQRCGDELSEKAVEGRRRPCCPSCGHVVFLDPKLAAAVLVAIDEKLLMVKRGTEPGIGLWGFPGGYVDRGERVEGAATREVEEETGLQVRITGLVGLYSATGEAVVLAVYSGERIGGNVGPGSDVLETGLFDPGDLPPLAFERTQRIIDDWQRTRAP